MIPRQKRSPLRRVLDIIYTTFVMLILVLPYILLAGSMFIIVFLLTLPYTLCYYSANFGMRPKDSMSMQVYVDAVQRNHPFANVTTGYKKGGKKHPEIKFYPHKGYTFSPLTGVLAALEARGWKRRVVYDFLHTLVVQSRVIAGPDFYTISKKMSSHSLFAMVAVLFRAPLQAIGKILPSGGEIQMWEGMGTEEVVTFEDLQWMARKGAVIRPQNERVLIAIELLDRAVGGNVWKFASAPSDVKGNQWQTVLKPRHD